MGEGSLINYIYILNNQQLAAKQIPVCKLALVKMQLKKKAQSSGNAKAASLAQHDEYSSEDSRPV